MAQTHQLLNFEPWRKPPKNRTLSHGSNPSIIELWAMAQTPKKWTFEPWLKPTFDMQIFTCHIVIEFADSLLKLLKVELGQY